MTPDCLLCSGPCREPCPECGGKGYVVVTDDGDFESYLVERLREGEHAGLFARACSDCEKERAA